MLLENYTTLVEILQWYYYELHLGRLILFLDR